jgi:hypothetical protein
MSELSPKQEKAAILLASGLSCKATAQEVGITPETISQWKNDTSFKALINTLKMEAILNAREQLRDLCVTAVAGIQDLMVNSKSDAVKLKACVEVLKMSGLHDSESFGWGIGPVESTDIEKDILLAQLVESLSLTSASYLGFKDS